VGDAFAPDRVLAKSNSWHQLISESVGNITNCDCLEIQLAVINLANLLIGKFATIKDVIHDKAIVHLLYFWYNNKV
jgi:hypothetical protein